MLLSLLHLQLAFGGPVEVRCNTPHLRLQERICAQRILKPMADTRRSLELNEGLT
jgi:hypothetical protein